MYLPIIILKKSKFWHTNKRKLGIYVCSNGEKILRNTLIGAEKYRNIKNIKYILTAVYFNVYRYFYLKIVLKID